MGDVPERRPDRLGKVVECDQGPVLGDRDRQLRQRSDRGTEHRPGTVEDVERRLVARAQEAMLEARYNPTGQPAWVHGFE
jgi:hypothetical protein